MNNSSWVKAVGSLFGVVGYGGVFVAMRELFGDHGVMLYFSIAACLIGKSAFRFSREIDKQDEFFSSFRGGH